MANLMTLEKKNRFFSKYKLRNFDFVLVLLALALSTIGVVAVASADASLRDRQIAGVIAGLIMALALSMIDYEFILKFWIAMYAVNVALLLLVDIRGRASHGASRWLTLGPLTFQPSESAKILLILFFAQFIMKYKEKMKPYAFIPLCVALLLPPLYLVYRQPDLSTSIMLLIVFAVVMFASGVDRRVVGAALIVVIVGAALTIYTAAAWDTHPLLDNYQQRRIKAWLHPEDYATEEALQTLNSLMAIGSGQLRGKGIHTSEITSVLNSGYISESETDLIFSVIGEEMGFFGGCAVVLLILLIAMKCLSIASRARDPAGKIIAAAVAGWIGFQGFMNIGVATGVVPNTGIPLPFVSSGLTSLISVYWAIGIVLNIGLQAKRRY